MESLESINGYSAVSYWLSFPPKIRKPSVSEAWVKSAQTKPLAVSDHDSGLIAKDHSLENFPIFCVSPAFGCR
jgi:hypothetical protein